MSAQPESVLNGSAPQRYILRHSWILVVLLIAALALCGAIFAYQRTGIEVQVTSPVIQNIETSVSSMGYVIPVNDFPARANFSGLVSKIYVKVGQNVRAGQMLIEMKDQYARPRLQNAIADLQSAQVSLDNVQRNGSQEDRIGFAADLTKAQMERDSAAGSLATLKQLEQRGSASESEVLAGMQRLQLAEANLHALKERTAGRYSRGELVSWEDKVNADKANLAAERVSWANAHIASPIAGTVYSLPVAPNDFVPIGNELLHVADLSRLEVRADFYEPDITNLRIGQPVAIGWEGAPGRSWPGHILSKPLAVDRNGPLSTGRCVIAIDANQGDLTVNTNVSVVVTVNEHKQVVTVPRQAVQGSGAKFVYRVENGRLEKTPVTIGLVNEMHAEIISGLTPRDVVVLRALNNARLINGRRVKADVE